MYAIRTYSHGEFFSNILAPKLMAEVLKWLILCLRKDLLVVQTMAKFSAKFYHQK